MSLPPGDSAGLQLWRATLAWQRLITSALRPHGLTHVQFVLLASTWWLEEHEDQPPTQRRLADHAGTDPMMTSQVLRTLEKKGLLDRTPDNADGRARRIRLTPNGQMLVARTLPLVEAVDADFFAPAREESTPLQALRALTDPSD